MMTDERSLKLLLAMLGLGRYDLAHDMMTDERSLKPVFVDGHDAVDNARRTT